MPGQKLILPTFKIKPIWIIDSQPYCHGIWCVFWGGWWVIYTDQNIMRNGWSCPKIQEKMLFKVGFAIPIPQGPGWYFKLWISPNKIPHTCGNLPILGNLRFKKGNLEIKSRNFYNLSLFFGLSQGNLTILRELK